MGGGMKHMRRRPRGGPSLEMNRAARLLASFCVGNMSRRRKAVLIESSSEEEGASPDAPAPAVGRRTLSRLRKADGGGTGAAEAAPKGSAAATTPPPPALVTPARPALSRQAPPDDSPRTGAQQRGLRQKLRDRGTRSAAKQRQQRALQRLTSGRGGVNDLNEGNEGKLGCDTLPARLGAWPAAWHQVLPVTHAAAFPIPDVRKWLFPCLFPPCRRQRRQRRQR